MISLIAKLLKMIVMTNSDMVSLPDSPQPPPPPTAGVTSGESTRLLCVACNFVNNGSPPGPVLPRH